MLDLIPADLREPIWYILAGFILGFAVSTLWEWLHFRRIRVQSLPTTTTHTTVNRVENRVVANVATDTQVLNQSPEFEPSARPGAYRSAAPIFQSERTLPRQQRVGDDLVKAELPIASAIAAFEEEAPDMAKPRTSIIPHEVTDETANETTTTSFRTQIPERTPDLPSVDSAQTIASTSLEQDNRAKEISAEADRTVAVEVPEKIVPVPVSSKSEARTPDLEHPFEPAPNMQAHNIEKTGCVETKTDEPGRGETKVDDPANEQRTSIPQEQASAVREQDHKTARVPRSRGYPDDLTKIRGIGDVYTRRLFAANIFTFHHVATSDVEVLRRATQAAPNANVESWPSQAEVLAQKSQRLNASYSGPLPDNLQQISGIGPFFAQTLYRNGICTFEQLADTSLEELRTILPPSVLGREVDLAQLLNVAREKVAERQK